MTMQHDKPGAALVSVFANLAIGLVQLGAGLYSGSLALVAEAAHTGSDLLGSVASLLALRAAACPPDEGHPYGHGKFENLAVVAEALLILLLAAGLAREAWHRLQRPEPVEHPGLALAALAVSIAVNLGLARFMMRTAKVTRSRALESNAWHWVADLLSNGAVLLGLGTLWLSRTLGIGADLAWVDPATTLAVAAVLVAVAARLLRQSVQELLDIALPPEELGRITRYLDALGAPVAGYHGLRCRRSGSLTFIEFHLDMDENLSVRDAHLITDAIELELTRRLVECHIQIHVEPVPAKTTDESKWRAAGETSNDVWPHGQRPGGKFIRHRSRPKKPGDGGNGPRMTLFRPWDPPRVRARETSR